MSKSLKALFALIVCLICKVQCHEFLDDFLNFSNENVLSESCASDLRRIKQGIRNEEIWALKGKET
jgi:uncharacterized protein YerC